MSALATPIHTAQIGAATLRFFRPPATTPDLPWHSHDDLARCLGLAPLARLQFLQMLKSGPFKDDLRVVGAYGGIVTIAPHAAAQGLITAAIEVGMASPDLEDEYVVAAIAAFKIVTKDLPPAAAMEMLFAAAGRGGTQ